MKKLIIFAITACLAIGAANAAKKLCTGTPIVWATEISLSPTSGTINTGAATTTTATVAPSNATTRTVIWSTSNSGIASVSGSGTNNATGTISGVSAGSATITAKTSPSAVENGITQFSATYTITVQVPPPPYVDLSGSICSSDPNDTNYFPYKYCVTREEDGVNIFQNNNCMTSSGFVSIYGKAMCSSQSDAGHSWQSSPRVVNYVPANDGGGNCWCQICKDSSRTECGAWMLYSTYSCQNGRCDGNTCSYILYNSGNYARTARIALCANPQ